MRARPGKLLGLALLLSACSAVHVRPTDLHEDSLRRGVDVLHAGNLSAATRDTLSTLGLREDGCRSAPQPCLRRLVPWSSLDDERRLSAAAELWLSSALAHDRARHDESSLALAAYLEAARASYAYLFFTARTPGERAFEDRQRQVRDFFNYATERVSVLFLARRGSAGRAGPESYPILHIGSWQLKLGFVDVRLPQDRPLRELVAASRLSFSGLRNAYRRDGFGTELVAVAEEPAERRNGVPETIREMGSVASSVVLRFPGETLDEVLATKEATLEAYDSCRHDSILLHGTEVRLAANFTAPYALWLEKSEFRQDVGQSLLGRTDRLMQPRVYLMQPYDPNRRTVVLLHGLASSPQAWVNLVNELMGDDEIRQHYQIWQVFYSSGAPLVYNRLAIRRALDETLARFDPDHTAAASRDMVLIGHSMGGVLARLLVVSSGARMWSALLGHPPSDTERQRLAVAAPYLDLTPMPEVSRAVFLASPHRGAPAASGWLGKIAAHLVRLPASLAGMFKQTADALVNDQPATAARLRRGPDGVDSLSDRFLFRKVFSELQIVPGVTYHSIIGCTAPGSPVSTCNDGLVPYSSAHLEGAASELILTSGHSVQKTPEAILELRRILHLHSASLKEKRESP